MDFRLNFAIVTSSNFRHHLVPTSQVSGAFRMGFSWDGAASFLSPGASIPGKVVIPKGFSRYKKLR